MALRHEYYTDFGTSNNYKIATKYKVRKNILLRASASSGFRAPSLAQSTYSYTASTLTDKTLYLRGIFQPSHPISQSLGAEELVAEDSMHYTLGTVIRPTSDSSLMIDYFHTRVDNKILLGDLKTPTSDYQKEIFDMYGVSNSQYFTNIANILTQGIDIKYNSIYTFSNKATLNTTFWYNYNKTEVINPDKLTLSAIKYIEELQPKSNIKLLNIYQVDAFKTAVNINYYDSIIQHLGGEDNVFDSEITVDLDINYRYSDSLDISLGGLNIFHTMPDKWTRSSAYVGYDGIVPYTTNSPIGLAGAYYYMKLNYTF